MFSVLLPAVRKVSRNQFNRTFIRRDPSIHRCNYGLAEDPFQKRIFVTFKRQSKGSPFRRAAAARPSLRQFFQFATEEKGGGTVHPRDETPRPVHNTTPRIHLVPLKSPAAATAVYANANEYDRCHDVVRPAEVNRR